MAQGRPKIPPNSKIPPNWRLQNLDTKEIFEPQYPIELGQGVAVTFGNVLAQQPRFGFEDPIIHFVQGKTKTFTFETVLYNEFSLQDTRSLQLGRGNDLVTAPATQGADRQNQAAANARRKFDARLAFIEAATARIAKLGRPPIFKFIYGARKSYAATVLVQDSDQRVVSLQNDGTPQEVRISFTLVRYVPFSQSQIDPLKPAKGSFLLVASEAERSYEAIARRFYGQPLLGDRLRKRHPGNPLAPVVGEVVKVPDRAVVLQELVDPAAHMLSLDDEAAVANFEMILEARNSRKLTVVV